MKKRNIRKTKKSKKDKKSKETKETKETKKGRKLRKDLNVDEILPNTKVLRQEVLDRFIPGKDIDLSRCKKLRMPPREDTPIPKGVKVIKEFSKTKCIVEGCKRNAVGDGDLCKKHGGDPVVPDNLLNPSEVPVAMAGTKYDPAIHPKLFLEYSKEGMSLVEIAEEFEVPPRTIEKWSETFLEFNTAFELGSAVYEAWWLREGKENLGNRGYNTQLFKFLTGNKLGYSDKVESKNMNFHAGVLMVPGKMSAEEWEEGSKEIPQIPEAIRSIEK